MPMPFKPKPKPELLQQALDKLEATKRALAEKQESLAEARIRHEALDALPLVYLTEAQCKRREDVS